MENTLIAYAAPVVVYIAGSRIEGRYWTTSLQNRSWVVVIRNGLAWPALVNNAQIEAGSTASASMPSWAHERRVGWAWCQSRPTPPLGVNDPTL